jgi:hypothetical protein
MLPVLSATIGPTGETTTDWIIAIGTMVAAVGTVAAVSVALWQTRRQSQAKLRVESKAVIERLGSSHVARTVVRLVGTNHGPQSIKVNEAVLPFEKSGATIVQGPTGGDSLPRVLAVGDAVTVEWQEDAVELARAESHGKPYEYIAFIDAFGRHHAAPYPGMRFKRKWWPPFRSEYVPEKGVTPQQDFSAPTV